MHCTQLHAPCYTIEPECGPCSKDSLVQVCRSMTFANHGVNADHEIVEGYGMIRQVWNVRGAI